MLVRPSRPSVTAYTRLLKRSAAVDYVGWVGIAGEVGEVEPPSYVYRRSFLSENRFKISITVQNFKHFDI